MRFAQNSQKWRKRAIAGHGREWQERNSDSADDGSLYYGVCHAGPTCQRRPAHHPALAGRWHRGHGQQHGWHVGPAIYGHRSRVDKSSGRGHRRQRSAPVVHRPDVSVIRKYRLRVFRDHNGHWQRGPRLGHRRRSSVRWPLLLSDSLSRFSGVRFRLAVHRAKRTSWPGPASPFRLCPAPPKLPLRPPDGWQRSWRWQNWSWRRRRWQWFSAKPDRARRPSGILHGSFEYTIFHYILYKYYTML